MADSHEPCTPLRLDSSDPLFFEGEDEELLLSVPLLEAFLALEKGKPR